MAPQAFRQVRAATRTEICAVREQIGTKLMLPEALITGGTFRNGVAPAVPEEQDTLFTAEIAGSLAIEMNNRMAAKPDAIVL